MARLLHLIDRICLTGAYGAALALAALFLLGFAEILSRNILGTSIAIASEYSGYLVALALLWGSGWTLNQAGHIRVSLLFEHWRPEMRWALDIAATVAGFVMAGLFAWALLDYSAASFSRGIVSFYPSATPLWLPQALLALGPTLLALAFFARFLRLINREAVA